MPKSPKPPIKVLGVEPNDKVWIYPADAAGKILIEVDDCCVTAEVLVDGRKLIAKIEEALGAS